MTRPSTLDPSQGVSYPSAAGIKWERGQPYTITWFGFPGSKVKVQLYKGGTLSRTLAASASNTGSLKWTVPTDQAIGSDYSIRVTSISPAGVSDSSDHTFRIASPPAPKLDLGSDGDLDFGSVVVGEVKTLSDAYVVRNAGGGVLTVTVSVAAPFHLLDDKGLPAASLTFSLTGKGAEKAISIDFAPFAAGKSVKTLSIQSNAGQGSRRLSGTGVLPTVSIVAADPTASEPGTNTGRFRISRTGTSGNLTVSFARSGSATFGTDYRLSVGGTNLTSTSVVIPSGRNYVDIRLTVRDDSRVEGTETAVLTLQPRTTYTLSAASKRATVAIRDND